MEKPRPLPNAEDLQRLVERFHRARWVGGVSFVSPEPFNMEFTFLGQRRMRQLFEALKGATAENLHDGSELCATDAGTAIINRFADAISELHPPALSPGEKETLVGLTIAFGKEQRW